MLLLNHLRQAANQILLPTGLSIERVKKQPWFRPAIVTAPIGGFSIQVPAINPVATKYSEYPDYTGHLGRVAGILFQKYPTLAAIDIGANVGDTACIILSAADVPLLCIEGDDLSFDFLKRNISQFHKASAHKLFLGEASETMAVTLTKDGWNTTLIPDASGLGQNIKIVTLDDFMASQPDQERYKLVKIDTEGFDCRILRGAKTLLREVQPVISFEYNRDNMDALGENGLDTLAMLADLGYSHVGFHDCDGRFFCSTTLSDHQLIQDLHDYADGQRGNIYYFDLTLFHECDTDIAEIFMKQERIRRSGHTGLNTNL